MARSSNHVSIVIVLNGPLGIGKSTLAEALGESLDACVMLDGDHVVAANPPPADEVAYLHETLALLFAHHRLHGYRRFVINHIWRTAGELEDLRSRLRGVDPAVDVRVFLLTLPLEENLRRIERRQSARALDEIDFERETVADERAALSDSAVALGEPFDVSAAPEELVVTLLQRLALEPPRS